MPKMQTTIEVDQTLAWVHREARTTVTVGEDTASPHLRITSPHGDLVLFFADASHLLAWHLALGEQVSEVCAAPEEDFAAWYEATFGAGVAS